MTRLERTFFFVCAAITCSPIFATPPSYTQLGFTIPAESENIVIADLNGDALNEFIVVIGRSLRIYFQRENGFDFQSGFKEINFLPMTQKFYLVRLKYLKKDKRSLKDQN